MKAVHSTESDITGRLVGRGFLHTAKAVQKQSS